MFEDQAYEIAPQYKPKRENSMNLMVALYAIHRFTGGTKKAKSRQSSRMSSVWAPKVCVKDRRQLCVAKMHYSKSQAAHRWQIEKYIKREDAGIDGKAPVLFGSTSEEDYKKRMVAKNYRIFLSPGKDGVPLQVLAEKFMDRLKAETGYKFVWLGAEHHNTAHPHAHIVINGVDAAGKEIWLNPALVKTLHEYAQNICTSICGERTDEEIWEDRERALEANRYTWIDKEIKEHVAGGVLNPGIEAFDHDRDKIKKRADHLAGLGLCRWTGESYELEPDWDGTLRTLGRYNMYLDAKRDLKYTDSSRYQLYGYDKGAVSGKVTKIYKTDDVSDNYAAVLESVDGKAYFVPLFFRPKIKVGDTVKMTPVKGQSGRLMPYIESETASQMKADMIRHGVEPNGFGASL